MRDSSRQKDVSEVDTTPPRQGSWEQTREKDGRYEIYQVYFDDVDADLGAVRKPGGGEEVQEGEDDVGRVLEMMC